MREPTSGSIEMSETDKSDTLVIPIVEEEARIAKRQVVSGRVIVKTTVDTEERILKEMLSLETVEVERIPINRVVDTVPQIRTDGDVTIVPVFEERLVVEKQLEFRRDVLAACEDCVERLTKDPRYFANPDKTLFQDIRRYFPITQQAQVAWAVTEGIGAAVEFIEAQIEAGAFDGGAARCQATTRKGKPCQRTPLPDREYCPSHQHLEVHEDVRSAA